MVVLDATAVTGALPALGRDLGFTGRDLQWVVTAYTLTFGGFLIVGGRVADLVGSRRAFAMGLLGFTAASLCCGLASSPEMLIASRTAQGAATALLSPAALAMLTVITTEGQERQRAVGSGRPRLPGVERRDGCWAACSPTRSAGAGCSWSISPSGWSRYR